MQVFASSDQMGALEKENQREISTPPHPLGFSTPSILICYVFRLVA